VAMSLGAFPGQFEVTCNSFVPGSNDQQPSRMRRSDDAKMVFRRAVARYLYSMARTSPWPCSE